MMTTSHCDREAFNRQELVDRCLGNLELVERLLQRFEREFPENLDRLAEFASKGDSEELRRLAHQLKGASANIAAPELRQQFAAIEELGSQNRLDESRVSLSELAREWSRFQEEVKTSLAHE